MYFTIRSLQTLLLPKRSEKKSVSCNYKLINLTSVETMLCNKWVSFLKENDLKKIPNTAFVTNIHTSQIYKTFITTSTFSIYNETKVVGIIHLDFQKAFNTVPHKRLFTKFVTQHKRQNPYMARKLAVRKKITRLHHWKKTELVKRCKKNAATFCGKSCFCFLFF